MNSNFPEHGNNSPIAGPALSAPGEHTVAVALNHEFNSDSVPHVVASGRGFVADQILNLAFEHGVKVRQDSDLAEILSAVDIEEEIPTEAFAAVSEILVYVYRANGLEAHINPAFQKGPDWTYSGGKTP